MEHETFYTRTSERSYMIIYTWTMRPSTQEHGVFLGPDAHSADITWLHMCRVVVLGVEGSRLEA